MFNKNNLIYSNQNQNLINYKLQILENTFDQQIIYSTYYQNLMTFSNTIIQDQEYDNYSIQNDKFLENFLFLKQSTITSFFISNMVDMPICFKKSKSLYSKTFELKLFKFTNLIMRSGLREKTLKNITLSFNNIFNNVLKNNQTNFYKWNFLFFFLSNIQVNKNIDLFENFSDMNLTYNHYLTSEGLFYNESFFLKNKLFEKLNSYTPLFSFYIRKVDKSIRKHSRGKSGKYTIIWKYVPIYKRLYITMRWFLKDLKYQKAKSFDGRLLQIIESFLAAPELSFISKLRKFAHHFVFFNYKNTLLKTLKSAS